ncbi:uncharacterized protein LOC124427654 [Vespa crabro]|uniref:uncharacterized protein LOC124427654 n=1 Tax=Vespa crabro TaxID=7445 RepID=UPI001F0216D1|nr:uncharacterized protein LOC124427654 [Vespa crabro]
MVTNFRIIFVFICGIIDCRLSYGSEVLTTALNDLTEFFEKLKTKYEYQSLNLNTLHQIDKEINSYTGNISNLVNRYKRQSHDSVNNDVAINILEGFDEISMFNVQDFKQTIFFPLQFNNHLFWFMAGINSNGMSLYQLNNNKFDHIKSYPQYNGMRIIVDNCIHNTVAVIQTFNESITILKFNYDKTAYMLSFVQTLQIPAITDIHTWHYMNRLYLGIASRHNISIYIWLGEHFDFIQVLNFGAEKLTFFHNKGFMNLICTGSRTVILRHFFHFDKFMIIQTLPASNAIMTFDIIKDHLKEYFICLFTHQYTVVYKEVHGYFVPFQKISVAEKIIPLIVKRAIILLLLNKNVITVYQYDGWRFVQLNVKISEVNDIYLIYIYENELIIIKHGVSTWKLMKPRWGERKSLLGFQNEIKSWYFQVKTIAKRIPKAGIIIEKPLPILNGYIREIYTQNINGYDSKEWQNLTGQYNYLITKFKALNDSLNQRINNNNNQFKTLRAHKVKVTCKSLCKVDNIIIKEKINPLSKLRSIENINQNLTFTSLKIENIDNFKCPIPAFTPKNFDIKGLINDISLLDLQENTLKTSGNQMITGDHIFVELDVVYSVMPLDIATNSIMKTVYAKEIRVKELHLKKDGFLLPLNGPPSKISGCITASKVKVKGLINLKGGLKGKSASLLMPVKHVPNFMEINGNRNFHNITIVNILRTKDVYRQNGKSLKNILDNGILIHNNFPMHLIFSNNNAIWRNVTIKDYNNWVTAHSGNKVVISGKKQTIYNVILPQSAYIQSLIPKYNFSLCTSTANVSNIKLSQVMIENMTVENLKSFQVFGAKELNSTIFETTTSINTVDLSKKYFIDVITIKDIVASDIKGFNLKGFQEILNMWIEKKIFKDIRNATRVKINNLQTPVRIKFPFPTTVSNVISKGNTYATIINGENIHHFLKNAVRVDDPISLNNITFSMGLKSNSIQFFYGPLNFTYPEVHLNLHSKHILGNVKIGMLNILKPIIYDTYNASKNYIIQGNITFTSEPIIKNINNNNLKKFSSEIYTIDQNMIISGNNILIKNMTVLGNNISKTSLYIPYYNSWTNISYSLLSKTKPQEINVPCWFNNIEVDSIKGSKNSSIKSFDAQIRNIIEMSLKKNESQVIQSKWHFDKLILSGYVNLQGKLNNMNLRTDVVKYSSKQNIITGTKTILGLSITHLRGLNFSEWSKNAVLLKQKNVITVKGQKIFTDINISNLSLDGAIMGKNIKNAFLKSKPQIINGLKIFDGNIKMSGLLIDGLMNDVNFTSFINNLLKKNKLVQTLNTDIILKDNLEVLGNIFIDGLYNGIKVNNCNREYNKMQSIKRNLIEIAEVINIARTALNSRAFYLNKLKTFKNITAIITNSNNNHSQSNINCQCELKNVSLFCNDTEIQGFSLGSNLSNYTRIHILLIKKVTFIVLITSDCVSIGNINKDKFYQKKVFCVPNILQASIESVGNSLWIILQLPLEMLALHYVSWDNVKQYTLPPSNILITSASPNNELLMLRSDGVWNINELGSPRHIFKTSLIGTIETFSYNKEYYIKSIKNNATIFMKSQYIASIDSSRKVSTHSVQN